MPDMRRMQPGDDFRAEDLRRIAELAGRAQRMASQEAGMSLSSGNIQSQTHDDYFPAKITDTLTSPTRYAFTEQVYNSATPGWEDKTSGRNDADDTCPAYSTTGAEYEVDDVVLCRRNALDPNAFDIIALIESGGGGSGSILIDSGPISSVSPDVEVDTTANGTVVVNVLDFEGSPWTPDVGDSAFVWSLDGGSTWTAAPFGAASTTEPGWMSTGAQSFAGDKDFNGLFGIDLAGGGGAVPTAEDTFVVTDPNGHYIMGEYISKSNPTYRYLQFGGNLAGYSPNYPYTDAGIIVQYQSYSQVISHAEWVDNQTQKFTAQDSSSGSLINWDVAAKTARFTVTGSGNLIGMIADVTDVNLYSPGGRVIADGAATTQYSVLESTTQYNGGTVVTGGITFKGGLYISGTSTAISSITTSTPTTLTAGVVYSTGSLMASGNLSGDVTTSGGLATTIANNAVTTAKIAADAVTYAKIQNVSAGDKLLGRVTGAGDVEEIACTAFARTILDDVDAAAVLVTLGISSGAVPTGTIVPFAGFVVPAGWLLCDGSAVSRTTYSALFSALSFTISVTTTSGSPFVSASAPDAAKVAITQATQVGISASNIADGTKITNVGTTTITMNATASSSATVTATIRPYGPGDGSTTFNLPDLRRRVPVGAGGTGTTVLENRVGSDGGAESHTLTTTEMPSHTHSYTMVNANAQIPPAGAGAGPAYTGGFTTNATGGGASHNNVQPSIVLNYIIKT